MLTGEMSRSLYAWKITVNEHGTDPMYGPRDASTPLREQLDAGKGEQFRIFDDDGELYCQGRIIGEYDGFEPLDDYGRPALGATEIHYREGPNKVWKQL